MLKLRNKKSMSDFQKIVAGIVVAMVVAGVLLDINDKNNVDVVKVTA